MRGAGGSGDARDNGAQSRYIVFLGGAFLSDHNVGKYFAPFGARQHPLYMEAVEMGFAGVYVLSLRNVYHELIKN